jgi:iron complex transport system ATP-binding protein
MLRARNLRIAVGERALIDDLSFDANAGEFWAVLGPNGSGKTTLMHTLAGLRAPSGGEVLIEDQPAHLFPPKALARKLALLPQREAHAAWGSVGDYVMLGRFAHDDAHTSQSTARTHAALAEMELSALARRPLHSLSGGELQRARIAQTWLQETPIMCLDEPLQHLDPRHQLRVVQRCAELARGARLIFMVLHDAFWALRYCTHALLVYGDARAVAVTGRAQELVTRERLADLYRIAPAHLTQFAHFTHLTSAP